MPSTHPGLVDLLVASYEKVEFKLGPSKISEPISGSARPSARGGGGRRGHFFVFLPWWLFFLVQFCQSKIRGVCGPHLNLPLLILPNLQAGVQVFSRPVIGWDVVEGVYQDLAIGTRHITSGTFAYM